MNKNSLLYILNDAPKNAKVFVTTMVNGELVSVPVTSMFVIKDPQYVFSGEIRIQCDKRHDAYVAFVAHEGTKAGTPDDFEKQYAGTWRNRESFATHHFDKTYPGLQAEIRQFVNITAYSARIFSTDFTAIHHDGQVFVFKES